MSGEWIPSRDESVQVMAGGSPVARIPAVYTIVVPWGEDRHETGRDQTMRRVCRSIILCIAVAAGCGGLDLTDYSRRLVGADGQTIVLEDVERIVEDSSLTEDERRSQLRELGIEDEKLIEALLGS